MSDKVENELRAMLDELGLAEIDDGQDVVFADLDLDSLTVMDLCVALEDRYDFAIDPADVVEQATLLNLARFIATKRPERA
jgi:acyl carrier protein